jgi:ferredoxin
MATGTGKTYTAFQIIWRLWKAGRKKRILFLADRNVLIEQTMVNDFRPFGGVMAKLSTHAKTIERGDGSEETLTTALDLGRQINKSYEVYPESPYPVIVTTSRLLSTGVDADRHGAGRMAVRGDLRSVRVLLGRLPERPRLEPRQFHHRCLFADAQPQAGCLRPERCRPRHAAAGRTRRTAPAEGIGSCRPPIRAYTECAVGAVMPMDNYFEEALGGRIDEMLVACTRCGKCVEACPAVTLGR